MAKRINCKAVISMALCMVMIAGILFPCNVHAASKNIGLVSENTCKKDDTAMYDVTNIRKAEQTISGKTAYSVKYGAKSFNLNCSTSGDGILIYSSSNPNIVSVDANGDVVIKRSGKVTITVAASETSTYRSASKTININVSKASQTIKVREELAIMVREGHYKLYNLGAVCDSGKVRYKSANTNIATVTSSGVVKANKWEGHTKIYVTALSDSKYKSASKIVRVRVSFYLGKPPKLKCKNDYGKITFTWDKVPGATGYKVYLYDKNKKEYICKMTKRSSQRYAVIREPKIGKRYTVRVRAYVKVVNGRKVYHGYGEESNTVSVIGK